MGIKGDIHKIVAIGMHLSYKVWADALRDGRPLDEGCDLAYSTSGLARWLERIPGYEETVEGMDAIVAGWWKAHDEKVQLELPRGRPRLH